MNQGDNDSQFWQNINKKKLNFRLSPVPSPLRPVSLQLFFHFYAFFRKLLGGRNSGSRHGKNNVLKVQGGETYL